MKDNERNIISSKCGLSICNNPTDVNIYSKGVTRCAKHFCQDLSDYKAGKQTPNIAGRFKAEKDIMDTLVKINLIQGEHETLGEYGQRCKTYCLQTMGGLLPRHLKEKSGTQPAQS